MLNLGQMMRTCAAQGHGVTVEPFTARNGEPRWFARSNGKTAYGATPDEAAAEWVKAFVPRGHAL